MRTILLLTICLLIATTAFAAPKLCLVWEQQQAAPGGTTTLETRSKVFDTVAEAVLFLDKKAIPDTAVTGLWELRPAAKQILTMQTIKKVTPEVIKEKRWTEIKWSAP